MSLGDGCDHHVIIQHEFTHALGFYHEQNRPDRDNAILVAPENINGNFCSAFEKCAKCRVFAPYNTKSIMQYPSYGFACESGRNTMLVKGTNATIPYNYVIQDTDVQAIKGLYGCT